MQQVNTQGTKSSSHSLKTATFLKFWQNIFKWVIKEKKKKKKDRATCAGSGCFDYLIWKGAIETRQHSWEANWKRKWRTVAGEKWLLNHSSSTAFSSNTGSWPEHKVSCSRIFGNCIQGFHGKTQTYWKSSFPSLGTYPYSASLSVNVLLHRTQTLL